MLEDIRNLLPDTRIIWSVIMMRLRYDGELNEGGGKASVINLNKKALNVVKAIKNAHVIRSYT
jgi:hypothetical protein